MSMILTEEFIRQLVIETGCLSVKEELFAYGRGRGWLEEQDELDRAKPISRQAAARIIHQFLRIELGQADEADWGPAKELLDLYDCRVCANHIAQVYAKGIMTAARFVDGKPVFDGRSPLGDITGDGTITDGAEILRRVRNLCLGVDISKAMAKDPTEKALPPVQRRAVPLPMAKLEQTVRAFETTLLIDVRSIENYRLGHPEGAVPIPMTELLAHPKQVVKALSGQGIFLFCERGIQSEIAANALIEAEFENVYYLGLVEDPPME